MLQTTEPNAEIHEQLSDGEARVQIANALTAILLHAEAIRQHSAGMGLRTADLSSSCQHIAMNAKRVWQSFSHGRKLQRASQAGSDTVLNRTFQ